MNELVQYRISFRLYFLRLKTDLATSAVLPLALVVHCESILEEVVYKVLSPGNFKVKN